VAGDRELNLARLLYLSSAGELRALWFATGYVDTEGRYFPMRVGQSPTMNVPDPRGKQAWGTCQDAEAIFAQAGKGLRLILTGFTRADEEIAWEDCGRWMPFNPAGICEPGLELELRSHGGSAAFLQSGIAPEDWFAFGWAIEFSGAGTDLPNNPGVCVP